MSLKDRLDDERAESWKPEPDAELIGKVQAVSTRTTEYGKYLIVTVKPDDAPALAFHAFHTVAANQIDEADPMVGDEIAIRYKGKNEAGDRPYHDYKVAIEHGPNWKPSYGAHLAETPEDGPADSVFAKDEVPF